MTSQISALVWYRPIFTFFISTRDLRVLKLLPLSAASGTLHLTIWWSLPYFCCICKDTPCWSPEGVVYWKDYRWRIFYVEEILKNADFFLHVRVSSDRSKYLENGIVFTNYFWIKIRKWRWRFFDEVFSYISQHHSEHYMHTYRLQPRLETRKCALRKNLKSVMQN